MKTYLFLLLLPLGSYGINAIPEIVQSKENTFTIYIDSPETERMGYGDWVLEDDGELLMIKSFIQEGDVVIDAGAHIGEWSAAVLEHTKNNCNLYSFEPVPQFFEQLKDKVTDCSKCHNIAIGKTVCETDMNYYYVESEGCSSLFERKVLNSIPVKKISIKVVNLDTFCKENAIDHIDFLKIDIEGCEWDAIQGADNLISAQKIKMIQFEYGGTYEDANITLQEIFKYFTAKNYSIFRLAKDGLIYIPTWRAELENYHLSNYLAVQN